MASESIPEAALMISHDTASKSIMASDRRTRSDTGRNVERLMKVVTSDTSEIQLDPITISRTRLRRWVPMGPERPTASKVAYAVGPL